MRELSCETELNTDQSHKKSGAGHEGQVTILRLYVHAETIAVIVAEADDEVRSLATISYCKESIRKLTRKLGPAEQLPGI